MSSWSTSSWKVGNWFSGKLGKPSSGFKAIGVGKPSADNFDASFSVRALDCSLALNERLGSEGANELSDGELLLATLDLEVVYIDECLPRQGPNLARHVDGVLLLHLLGLLAGHTQ